MKLVDRITLRYASTLIESEHSPVEAGSIEYTFTIKLGDLTSKVTDLKNEIADKLNDDTVEDAFTSYYFSNLRVLEGNLWSQVKHLEGISNISIEEIEGIPKRLSDLKNVTLELKAKINFEAPRNLLSDLEKRIQEYLKSQF